jgi:MFS family permease
MAGAAGPLVGGALVDAAGWRWVFLVNVPIAVVIAALLASHVPESRDDRPVHRFDVAGALLGHGSSPCAAHGTRRCPSMKAEEFDERFDRSEDAMPLS